MLPITKGRGLFYGLLLATILGGIGFSAWYSSSRRAISTPIVQTIRGSMGIWDSHSGTWREAAPGEALVDGEALRVSGSGEVELAIGSSAFVLGPGCQVTPVLKNGQLVQFELERGALKAHWSAQDGAVMVATSAGSITLQDSELIVALEGAHVFVRVEQGSASATRTDGSVQRLDAGQDFDLTAGRPAKESAGIARLASFETPPPPEPALSGGTGRLMLRDASGHEADALEVSELRVRAHIQGPVALTEIEETFYNPTDRRAEGTFYFPLPAGASICRFAMYIDDQLVEGELVERVRARQIYEDIVRRMQDPALMEWQEGNIFKTRIFPIPPHGPKRILISYMQVLPARDSERSYVFPLLSKTTQAGQIGKFEADLELEGLEPDSRVRLPAYPDAQINTEGSLTRVQLRREGFRPVQDLALRFTQARHGDLELITDRREGEDGFFLLSYTHRNTMDLPRPPETSKDLVVLFDTSLSRRADDYRAQVKALRAVLREQGPHDRFAVIPFDVTARPPSDFATGTEAAEACLQRLAQTTPLGATDFSAALEALNVFLEQHAHSNAEVLCISDGLATMGETAPDRLAARVLPQLQKQGTRLHALALGGQHDGLLLGELARQSGGLFRVINPGDELEREVFRFALALQAPLQRAPEFVFTGGNVSLLYPKQPGTLAAGEELILMGRYAQAGRLQVQVKLPGDTEQEADFELPETDSRNVFIPRLWARERLEQLMLAPQTPELESQIADLSQEFTLITPYTSFLVLENEAQYRKYGVSRQKRRRYWEEMGKQRTAPPSTPVPSAEQLVVPPNDAQPSTEPSIAEQKAKADLTKVLRFEGLDPHDKAGRIRRLNIFLAVHAHSQAAEEARDVLAGLRPRLPERASPILENLDLGLAAQRYTDGREVSTALSILCLETYYRYLQMDTNEHTPASVEPAALEERPVVVVAAVSSADAPVQTRDLEVRPEAVAPAPITDVTPEDFALHSRQDELDRHLDSTGQDFLDNAALEGEDHFETLEMEAGSGSGSFGQRGGGGRRTLIARHGGSVATENLVDQSLTWLARHQFPDGHWGAAGYEETSLALLSFLGAGHTEKVGKYREVVAKGLRWLIAQQSPEGRIGKRVYEQALATLALSEAAGMGRIPKTVEAAYHILQYLLDMQEKKGQARLGWSESSGQSEPFDTAWATLALRSAKIAGLYVPPQALEGAGEYLDSIVAPNGAVGATGLPQANEVHLMNTAAALAARIMLGRTPPDAKTIAAANLLHNLVRESTQMTPDGLFMRYFGTLGQFHMGGDFWKKWNDWLKQDRQAAYNATGAENGSWNPEGIWVQGRKPLASTLDAEKEIAAALAEIHKHDPSGLSHLAEALSDAREADLVRKHLEAAESADAQVQALMRLRLGMLLAQRQNFEKAYAEFLSSYKASGQAENILVLLAGVAGQAGQSRELLELMLKEHNAGLVSDLRDRLLGTLLFDPRANLEDPSGFVAARLSGEASLHPPLLEVLGQMAQTRQNHPAQAAFFRLAYQYSGEDERYAAPLIQALRQNGQAADALAFLLREANTDGRATHWRLQTMAELCFEPAAKAGAPVDLIAQGLAAQPEIRLALFDLAAAHAETLSQRPPETQQGVEAGPAASNFLEQACQLYGKAYVESGRRERFALKYVHLLKLTGKLQEARELLVREARNENRVGAWRMKALAEIVAQEGNFKEAPENFADQVFHDRPRARVALKWEFAGVAEASRDFSRALRLYEDIYLSSGRPEAALQPYVTALMENGAFEKASAELERCLQTGYHEPWIFETLLRAYQAQSRSGSEILRAASCEVELLPRDAQPRINLAEYFESHGMQAEALEQWREAIRFRPEDAAFHRQAVERAVKGGNFEFAQGLLIDILQRWPNAGNVWGAGDKDLSALLEGNPKLSEGPQGVVLKKLIQDFKLKDLVVVMSWDTNATDVDLHVTEPSGEESDYTHKDTFGGGGSLDHDITTGYGPETYTLRRARPGTYKVEVLYYSGGPPTNVTVKIIRNQFSANETTETQTVKLTQHSERITVETLQIKPKEK